ncbi:hypothetical protein KI387_029858, partial [Taxus chinensis]
MAYSQLYGSWLDDRLTQIWKGTRRPEINILRMPGNYRNVTYELITINPLIIAFI